MTNIEKLKDIFAEIFSCDESDINDGFEKNNVPGWDSVRQLSLVSTIENEFDIMLDAEDILECVSFENTKRILLKYNIGL